MNELDIGEVNLKRAGITAEFGRTAGIGDQRGERAGSNQFAGIGRVDCLPSALVGAYKLPPISRTRASSRERFATRC